MANFKMEVCVALVVLLGVCTLPLSGLPRPGESIEKFKAARNIRKLLTALGDGDACQWTGKTISCCPEKDIGCLRVLLTDEGATIEMDTGSKSAIARQELNLSTEEQCPPLPIPVDVTVCFTLEPSVISTTLIKLCPLLTVQIGDGDVTTIFDDCITVFGGEDPE